MIYKPGSVEWFPIPIVISLGERSLIRSSSLPTAFWSRRAVSRRLFGLAPIGVYHAVTIAGYAVSSYLTISPLPARSRRSVFCGTIRHHLHGAQVLPGGLPYGARTFLDASASRLSDHPHSTPINIAKCALTVH
jgi:hypothetical protein